MTATEERSASMISGPPRTADRLYHDMLAPAEIVDLRVRKARRRRGTKLVVASSHPTTLDANADAVVRFARGDAQLEEAAGRAGQERQVHVTGDDPPGTWRMPASLILLQAVNHGTEHRSQVATILTQLGVEPPEMDGWTYFDASGQLIPV